MERYCNRLVKIAGIQGKPGETTHLDCPVDTKVAWDETGHSLTIAFPDGKSVKIEKYPACKLLMQSPWLSDMPSQYTPKELAHCVICGGRIIKPGEVECHKCKQSRGYYDTRRDSFHAPGPSAATTTPPQTLPPVLEAPMPTQSVKPVAATEQPSGIDPRLKDILRVILKSGKPAEELQQIQLYINLLMDLIT